MAERLREQQLAFAAHIRDPLSHPAPAGIEPRRMAVYRDLFFGNLASLLGGNFPVLRRTLGEEAWRALLRRFYARHRCRTPLFTEVGRELLRYLEGGEDEACRQWPWLHELAHYEWVELALQLADDEPPRCDPRGDLLHGVPLLSPLAWPLAYTWPVQRIGPGFQPTEPPPAPTLLLVRRDAGHRIHFSELSPLLFRLLQLLGEQAMPGEALLRQLAAEAGRGDDPGFRAEGLAMLARLRDEGIVPGTRTLR